MGYQLLILHTSWLELMGIRIGCLSNSKKKKEKKKKKKRRKIMDNERIPVLGLMKSVTMNEFSTAKWTNKKAWHDFTV